MIVEFMLSSKTNVTISSKIKCLDLFKLRAYLFGFDFWGFGTWTGACQIKLLTRTGVDKVKSKVWFRYSL